MNHLKNFLKSRPKEKDKNNISKKWETKKLSVAYLISKLIFTSFEESKNVASKKFLFPFIWLPKHFQCNWKISRSCVWNNAIIISLSFLFAGFVLPPFFFSGHHEYKIAINVWTMQIRIYKTFQYLLKYTWRSMIWNLDDLS